MEPMPTSAHYRCADCKSTSVNPRNLVVFIDGTSNKPGEKNTNVFKLHAQTKIGSPAGAEPEQHAYYLKGIGAYDTEHLSSLSRGRKKIYASFEMVFAWNAEKNVQKAYEWLANKYRPGDQIYLFGFSRGGYQVRALASMIHEVGLVTDASYVETAYNKYLALDKYNPETQKLARDFKQSFCREEVRVHFVGVWDTVSSLGLIFKRVPHITSSASVTNACHFRQALALDEYRVKFMPEYFLEINAYRSSIRNPRSTLSVVDGVEVVKEVGDVKEVWFAGCHSDVGGTDHADKQIPRIPDEYDPKRQTHADNMPLLWMEREAAANGLLFKDLEASGEMDTEITNSMKSFYMFLEGFPIRYQVSFSGAGKHAIRPHWFRPRLVIPCQQVHNSVWSHKAYTPYAALGNGVRLPPLSRTIPEGIWNVDEAETNNLLSRLLSKETVTLRYLETVLFLLDSMLGKSYEKSIPKPEWSTKELREQSNLAKVALNIIGYVTCQPTDSEKLVTRVRETLDDVFESGQDQDLAKILYILRFSAMHQPLRRRFVGHDEVIKGLVLALEWSVENADMFPLIVDSLDQLIWDDETRQQVVEQLNRPSDGTSPRPKLSILLEVKSPQQLTASLRMISSLAQFQPDLCNDLKSRIRQLAKGSKDPVGPMAVEALATLKEDFIQDIPFSNILGYLDSTLPLLDVEGGSNVFPDIDHLTCVRQIVGSTYLKRSVLNELVSTIKSGDSKKRTLATFILLKLCKHVTIRDSCSEYNILEIFLEQQGKESTYLLAAYALSICLGYEMRRKDNFYHRAAEFVIAMLDKGWFDDSIGRLEGREIFRRLMTFDNLREQVLDRGQVNKLLQKLAVCERHEVRMNMIFLEILGLHDERELTRVVTSCLEQLRHKDQKVQKKGIKILGALGQTLAGENVIKEHVVEIVNMLLQPNLTRSQVFGPSAALYDLCKNETLREHIRQSKEFQDLQERHRNGTLRPVKG